MDVWGAIKDIKGDKVGYEKRPEQPEGKHKSDILTPFLSP